MYAKTSQELQMPQRPQVSRSLGLLFVSQNKSALSESVSEWWSPIELFWTAKNIENKPIYEKHWFKKIRNPARKALAQKKIINPTCLSLLV